MGSIGRRLRALEAGQAGRKSEGWPQKNLEWYFAALDNARTGEKEGR